MAADRVVAYLQIMPMLWVHDSQSFPRFNTARQAGIGKIRGEQRRPITRYITRHITSHVAPQVTRHARPPGR